MINELISLFDVYICSIPSLENSPSVPFDAGTHRTKSLLHELYKKYDMPERDKGPSGGKTQNKDRGSTLSKYSVLLCFVYIHIYS